MNSMRKKEEFHRIEKNKVKDMQKTIAKIEILVLEIEIMKIGQNNYQNLSYIFKVKLYWSI